MRPTYRRHTIQHCSACNSCEDSFLSLCLSVSLSVCLSASLYYSFTPFHRCMYKRVDNPVRQVYVGFWIFGYRTKRTKRGSQLLVLLVCCTIFVNKHLKSFIVGSIFKTVKLKFCFYFFSNFTVLIWQATNIPKRKVINVMRLCL